MDPVTLAMVAALDSGVVAGVTEASKELIVDTYTALRGALKRRFGAESAGSAALTLVEKEPQNGALQRILSQEVTGSGADAVPEIGELAAKLRALIEARPGGKDVVARVVGNYNATAIDHSTATVNLYGPPPERPGDVRR